MEKAHPDPSPSVSLAIVDTSVYVELYRKGAFAEFLLESKYLIRGCSVVMAELARGARTETEKKFVQELSTRLRLITPTESDWMKSGRILRQLSQKYRYDVQKTREIQFDVLIALCARRIGGAMITVNRSDFEKIQEHLNFQLVIPA